VTKSDKEEVVLRVLSIRDKISKLTESLTLKETFYMEIRLKR
jgi:hypothetical protein